MDMAGLTGIRLASACLLVAFLSLCGLTSASDPGRADYFIEAYGRVTAQDHETVAEAHKVFTTLTWVSQNQISNIPRLVVVNSEDKPWAIALPDNSVILSMGAVTICDSLMATEKIQACLAFVLGHELAHLSNRDFWHRDTYLILQANDNASNQYSDREIELKADEVGYLYASLAGYAVEKIFDVQENLFDLWVSHAQGTQSGHTKVRNFLIRNRIDNLASKLVLVEHALALTSFERFEDGIPLYQELINIFPAKEFFNNIGYSYLRLAMRSIFHLEDNHFIFPALLETEYIPGKHSKTLHLINTSIYIHQLGKAVTYLERALEINKLYTPALYNLAITQFLLGEYHEARALIERAIKLEPGNHVFQMVRSIIVYRQETDIDMWPLTVTRLEALSKKHPEDYLLKYNLASMYRLRRLNRQSGKIYTEIMGNSNDMNLKTLSCNKLTPENVDCAQYVHSRKYPWHVPLHSREKNNKSSTHWTLGSFNYKLYANEREDWLYINDKPALYSTDVPDFLPVNTGQRCIASGNAIAMFGGNAVFCRENVLRLNSGRQSPTFWVKLEG